MKKYTLLFLLMAVGLFTRGYGQEKEKRLSPNYVGPIVSFPFFLPFGDTVIMQGEEIEVGAFFKRKDKDRYEEMIEVVGFGRSKKSDVDKGYFVVKLKPKQTTKYDIVIHKPYPEGTASPSYKTRDRRIVHVAKTEEEKKRLEEELYKKRKLQKEQLKEGLGVRLSDPNTVR